MKSISLMVGDRQQPQLGNERSGGRSGRFLAVALLVSCLLTQHLIAAPTSENNARLKTALKNHPEADTNKDGVLTMAEAKAYVAKNRGGAQGRGGSSGPKVVSGKDVPEAQSVKGKYGLYMGHSFFIPTAKKLLKVIPDTRVINHTKCSVMAGGPKGSPKMLWENTKTQAAGKKFLDSGKVEYLVMTYFSAENSAVEHYSKWFDYALTKNPDITFMVTTAWTRHLYKADVKELEQKEKNVVLLYENLVLKLRKKYPNNKVLFCPYGLGVYELVRRLKKDELPGVKYVLDPNKRTRNQSKAKKEQILNDELGHGGDLVSHLNSLVWLQTIYDYDMSSLKKQRVPGLPDVDLNEIATKVYQKVAPFNAVYKRDVGKSSD